MKFLSTISAALLLTALPVFAAPGDPSTGALNIAQGGVNDHDPYFEDFSRPDGMTALSNGNLVVGWDARNNNAASPTSPDGGGYGSFFRIYSGTGTPLSSTPTAPYLDINSNGTGRQDAPFFIALKGGGFAMSWNSAGGPGDTYLNGSFGGDAYMRVYDNSGSPVCGTTKVNESDPTGTPDEQDPVGGVALSDGGFAIVWNDDNDALTTNNNTDDLFVRSFDANGTPRGNSTRIGGIAQDAFYKRFGGFSSQPGIVALANGHFAVCYSADLGANNTSTDGAGQGAFFQIFNADGSAATSATKPYSDINSNGTGDQLEPFISALTGGGFMVTWNSVNGPGDVFADQYGYGGDTYVRVFNDSGVGVSSTSKVNDLRNDNYEHPVASVALSGGGFAIVWHEDEDAQDGSSGVNQDDFYVRAYAASGTASNPSILIGGAAADPLFEDFDGGSGLVALSDGGYAVAIDVRDSSNNGTGTSLDGGGNAAVIRAFNANGTARSGVTFPYLDINPDGSGSQNIPLLTATTNGFAVTWNSAYNTNDTVNDQGSGYNGTNGGDTYSRLYDNNGSPLHGTTRAHDTEPTGTTDVQDPYAIEGLSNGGYVVLLRDDNQNTGNKDDLFVRFFAGSVTNNAPVAGTDTYSTNEDTLLTVPAPGVKSNDTDPDAGTTLSITGHTNPSHGTLNFNNSTGAFTYSPNANYYGADSFSYTLSDGSLTDDGTVNITVTAVADTPSVTNASTNEDTQTTSGLVITRNPADSTEVTHFKITNITNGTLYQNNGTTAISNGSFITYAQGNAGLKFTPNANFFGNGSFDVQASTSNANAGLGGSVVTATITVTSVNDAPVANNNSYNTAFGTTLTVNAANGILTNDTDVENNTLTVADGNAPTTPSTIDPVMAPAHGTLVLNANGSFTYTPDSLYSGQDFFTYKASDGQGANNLSNTATVTITIAANIAPVAVDDTSATTTEDNYVDINVVQNDTDADNGPLVVAPGSISNVHGGTAVVQPDGKTVRFTPSLNANNGNTSGGFGFSYQVSDGASTSANSANVTVSVSAVNDAPTITSVTITPGMPKTEDILTANVVSSDDDNDTLTYTYEWRKNGELVAADFNYKETLDLSKPGVGDNGDSITVKVIANDGTTNSAPVTSDPVTISNRLPKVDVVSPLGASNKVGEKRTFTLTMSDANGAKDIREMWLLINSQLDWSGGATLIYRPSASDPTTGQLFLRRGDEFLPPITVGTGASSTDILDNGAVRVVATDIAITSVGGNGITLALPLTIRDGLVGQNTLFARVQDSDGATDPAALAGDFGFIRSGSYTVTSQFSGGPNSAPTLSALTPGATYTTLNASGIAPAAQTFGFFVKDENGIGDIESLWFLANKTRGWNNSATFVYYPRTRRLVLRSDDGNSFVGGGQIGQPGIIENSQVKVDLSKVILRIYPDGKTLGLSLPLQAKTGLLGNNGVWLRVQDNTGLTSPDGDDLGFVRKGGWDVKTNNTKDAKPSNGNS
ncbi:hypothetical protein IAD21_00655 [Abditibacteriota bacterium]|nr:hypothetical protein IAD21_00655 [Abditibacteriota bacterium]